MAVLLDTVTSQALAAVRARRPGFRPAISFRRRDDDGVDVIAVCHKQRVVRTVDDRDLRVAGTDAALVALFESAIVGAATDLEQSLRRSGKRIDYSDRLTLFCECCRSEAHLDVHIQDDGSTFLLNAPHGWLTRLRGSSHGDAPPLGSPFWYDAPIGAIQKFGNYCSRACLAEHEKKKAAEQVERAKRVVRERCAEHDRRIAIDNEMLTGAKT